MILEPYNERTAERVAKIIGEHSAARKTLDELNRRRANGETVGLFFNAKHRSVVVGPTEPEPKPKAKGDALTNKNFSFGCEYCKYAKPYLNGQGKWAHEGGVLCQTPEKNCTCHLGSLCTKGCEQGKHHEGCGQSKVPLD